MTTTMTNSGIPEFTRRRVDLEEFKATHTHLDQSELIDELIAAIDRDEIEDSPSAKRLSFLMMWHSPGFREALDFYLALSAEVQERLRRTGELGGDDV